MWLRVWLDYYLDWLNWLNLLDLLRRWLDWLGWLDLVLLNWGRHLLNWRDQLLVWDLLNMSGVLKERWVNHLKYWSC
ncbi:hypothetical protein SAMD00019534_126780 [Acytostelium subglobosum LB1]|uniref:hypothetical protein n=1 Tax=Acytostelium subglobosum LB1 TaxID=1410327 RepID=UPI000644BEF8|nr:hypothetical protein SAMD00019534_126780 [Acytostelium subglobosum LB1]GAM29502.1 hypothetical protein SAMD00019534_126780 [Acytostelium subglobosum LB1]|eukprot:XP_012747550.1 hypothetical protein SAMD00019534_126780 [Acytostelium subglobosum LB1]